MKVSPDFLLTYLVKLAILHYRGEPRFRAPDKLPSEMASLSINSQAATRRTSSYAGTTASASPGISSNGLDRIQSSKSQLPKDVVEILKARLEGIVIFKKTLKYTPDDLSKRIFGRFLGSLSGPTVSAAIKRSRSPFDLLMFFLTDASKELQTYNESTQTHGTTDPSVYVPNFIHLLVDSLREKGYGSSHASLISELESFRAASSKGQTLRPKSSQLSNPRGPDGSSPNSLGPEANVVKPSFKLSDMTSAKYLADLFGYSPELMQSTINSLKDEATEKAAVAEIKFLRDDLEIQNRHPTYSRSDFHSESAFNTWKSAELITLNQQATHFIKQKSSLATVLPLKPEAGSDPNYVYLPPDPRSFYRLLVQMCLQHDATVESDLILSKSALDLLQKVTQAWRLTHVTRGLIFFHVSVHFYEEEKFSLTKLAGSAIDLARAHISDHNKELIEKDNWPESDKLIAYGAMKELHSWIVDKIVLLLQGIFNTKRPDIKPFMMFLADNCEFFSDFPGYPEVDITPDQHMAIKEVVIGAAQDRYGELVAELPRDHTLSHEHLVRMADELNAYAKVLKKRYPGKLFGVSISKLALRDNYASFAKDCEVLVNHVLAMQKKKDYYLSISELSTLYEVLCETRASFVVELRTPFPFDIEDQLQPFVYNQLQLAFDKPVTWVDPAIGQDSFTLPLLEPGHHREIFCSSSVGDIFSSFNDAIGLLNNLQWDNQVHLALFYTIAMKVSFFFLLSFVIIY